MSGSFQRYTRDDLCPTCGHYATDPDGHCHGGLTDGGAFARCTRIDGGDGAMLDAKCTPPAYVYRRQEDGSYRPWTKAPPMQPIHGTKHRTEAYSAPHSATEKAGGKTHPRPAGRRTYAYSETEGVEAVRAVAGGKKECYPRVRDHAGAQWGDGTGIAPRERIYRRDDLDSSPDAPVYVVEGEGCADALHDAGLLAITWRGGCGQLRHAIPQIVEAVSGRDIRLLPDPDGTGRSAMRDIAMALRGFAKSVRIVCLYEDESGRDIEDWLHEGRTIDRLLALIDATPAYETDAGAGDEIGAPIPNAAIPELSAWDRFRASRTDLCAVLEDGVTAPEFLADPVILKAKVHGFAGPPESGKTMVVLGAGILPVLRAGGRVMFLDEEGGDFEIASRLVAMGASEDEIGRLDYFAFKVAGSLDEMAATLHEGAQRERYALIVFDSASKLFAKFRLDENSNSDATRLMTTLIVPLARLYGCAVVFLDHVTKSDEGGRYGRGASAKLADVDVQWSVQMTAPLSRTSHGRIVLTRQKDRTASVPGSVRYIAGGDAEGGLTVALEGTSATPPARMNSTDREMLVALHGERNHGLRYAEWMDAAGKSPSTFKESRRRLMDAGLAEQRDDFYRVTDAGIGVIAPPERGPDRAETGADGLSRPIGDAGPDGPDSSPSGPSGPARDSAAPAPPSPATSRRITEKDMPHLFPAPRKAGESGANPDD